MKNIHTTPKTVDSLYRFIKEECESNDEHVYTDREGCLKSMGGFDDILRFC